MNKCRSCGAVHEMFIESFGEEVCKSCFLIWYRTQKDKPGSMGYFGESIKGQPTRAHKKEG